MKKNISRRDFLKGCAATSAAAASVAVLGACSSSEDEETTAAAEETEAGTDAETEAAINDALSEEEAFSVCEVGDDEGIYMAALGEFYDTYEPILDDKLMDSNEKTVICALSEAKYLESGAGTPTDSNGGGYRMEKYAYRTGDYSLWGLDGNRKWAQIITNEPITNEDYTHLQEMWVQLQGTGTYRDSAKEYLEEQGYTFSDTYQSTFDNLPTNWDIIGTGSIMNQMPVVDTTCNLMEYDSEGVQQPALAESYEVSDDGLTYTFHIREGQVWVDSQGRTVADIVADDWVAGMQHMLDTQSGLQTTISGIIKGMDDYANGFTNDFDDVGVKALDEYTLEYTLEQPCSYFTSLLSYAVFLPMSRNYYESQGGQFGQDVWNSNSNYTYGTDSDHIAYNGPFLLTNVTDKNSMNYAQNKSYWNADNMSVKNIVQYYDDNTDATRAYNDFQNGFLTSCSLTGARLEISKSEGTFDDYAIVDEPGSDTSIASINLNRQAFENANDGSCPSPQTEEQRELCHAAKNNRHFRLALSYAKDRATYDAISVGDDLKYATIRNGIVPGTFSRLTEDVTVDVNGVSTTFPSGTFYGEIVQAQLDADEFPAKVWDEDTLSSDGFDGWYNPDQAKVEIGIAVEQLAELGYEVTEENPIVIDYAIAATGETNMNLATAYSGMIDSALGGLVKLQIVEASDNSTYDWASGRSVDHGNEVNTDISLQGHFSPSYGDPSSYMEEILPYGDGTQSKFFGLW